MGYVVCRGAIGGSTDGGTEVRWVEDPARQEVVAIAARDAASADWRPASHREGDRLVAAINAGMRPQQWFRARRLPIWAEARPARCRLAMQIGSRDAVPPSPENSDGSGFAVRP